MTERVRAWEPVLQDLEHEPQLVQPETTQLTYLDRSITRVQTLPYRLLARTRAALRRGTQLGAELDARYARATELERRDVESRAELDAARAAKDAAMVDADAKSDDARTVGASRRTHRRG